MLYRLYTKILSQLEAFPKEATYREKTEQVVQQRLQIVESESNTELIEKKIGCGQVEELIDQVRYVPVNPLSDRIMGKRGDSAQRMVGVCL